VEPVNSPRDHLAARKLMDIRASLLHEHAADESFGLKAHAMREAAHHHRTD
jgi:hypothetical protein